MQDSVESKIILKDVMIRFPVLFTPKAKPGADKATFGLKAAIEPGSENERKIKAEIKRVCDAKWGAKSQTIQDNFTRTGRKPDVCFIEAPYTSMDGDVWNGFEGKYTLTTASQASKPPLVVDADRTPLRESDGRPVDGSICNISVKIYAHEHKTAGRSVRAQIAGVQFVRHGNLDGAGVTSDGSEFEVIAAADEDFV